MIDKRMNLMLWAGGGEFNRGLLAIPDGALVPASRQGTDSELSEPGVPSPNAWACVRGNGFR